MTIAVAVYLLCAVTSFLASLLLLRGYLRTRARLLLWSGLCFLGLFVNNGLLVLDASIVRDLSILRSLPAVVGVALLVYGLIWESDR